MEKLFYISKPAAVFILIVMLLFSQNYTSILFFPILVALIFSFFGDVFLLFEGKGFEYGIAAFLLAHISYSFAFMQHVDKYNYYLLVPIFFLTFGFYLYLVKDLGKFRRSVSIYISIITLMVWLAANRFVFYNSSQNTLILAGAVLFVISDSLLALHKFSQKSFFYKTKFPYTEIIILSTYYVSQYLFVMAVYS